MKTTIETIGGKQYTVVKRKISERAIEELAITSPETRVTSDFWLEKNGEDYSEPAAGCPAQSKINSDCGNQWYSITILPALPRHPKPEDAPLLYRYMAEGLYPHGTNAIGYAETGEPIFIGGIGKITHAVLAETGERVEIAITDGGEK